MREDLRVYAWGNNSRRAELKGRRCRIIAVGYRLGSVLVEFENGERVVTSARALPAWKAKRTKLREVLDA